VRGNLGRSTLSVEQFHFFQNTQAVEMMHF
jgi:hypothetical protein